MFLDGFGITGYRSFGSELQKIGPLKKINFFVGQNNSGKSNILLFLKKHFHSVFQPEKGRQRVPLKFSDVDKHLNLDKSHVNFAIAMILDGNIHNTIKSRYSRIIDNNTRVNRLLDHLITSEPLTNNTQTAWFLYSAPSLGEVTRLDEKFIRDLLDANILTHNEWNSLWSALTEQGQGDIIKHWIPETLSSISPITINYPKIELIPAIRKIGEPGETASDDYSGIGIIDRLARIQNPAHNQQYEKDKFQNINAFLREVTNNNSATLEIPYNRDSIIVHMDSKSLPLSSLGTGIHEVVILAAAATVLEEAILCIEEPELHLHPILLKRLCNYLAKKTNNQYMITTHSAHLLDTPDTAVFHVRFENGTTTVEAALNSGHLTSIFADLGFRASDLLQSNSIIWVEGPSDRIYLNHWIRSEAPDLLEGIHYSVMFYGGRLLSHLTANDSEVNEFISLRRLNRYISIVIDSDKTHPDDDINDTKKRIQEEFDKGPGFAWITEGREIENYVEQTIMEKAIKSIYPKADSLTSTDAFTHSYYYKTNTGELKDNIDKIKIAHKVAEENPNLDILDLKEQLSRVIDFIRNANGL